MLWKSEWICRYFVIDLYCKWLQCFLSGGNKGFIFYEFEFFDYNQYKCCGGCYSGCVLVVWVQVFGYFDRIFKYNFMFSLRIFGDSSIIVFL